MKISIWKEANQLPTTKKDKEKLAKLTSGKNNLPSEISIDNEDQLISAVTTFCWSPSLFDGHRTNKNFKSCDFMVLDIDDGLSIEQSEARIAKTGLACLCLPSPSFTEKNQKHRLVFPLAKTIYSTEDFNSTLEYLFTIFPEGDRQCVDTARWFCMSKLDSGFWQDGAFLMPKTIEKQKTTSVKFIPEEAQVIVPEDKKELVAYLYGKERTHIPESVEFFLTNAHTGLPGLWINSLNSFCFSLSLSGIDGNIIHEVVEKLAPSSLDNRDIYQINRSIKDAAKVKREQSEGNSN
jgi:hypothetical protein